MRFETAVRRRLTGPVAIDPVNGWAFPQVKPSVVGLAGLEPAASSLSGIFAGCVQAARALGVQVIADMSVTVVVR
jgi:hypothetical protein